jgi:hypothetical protein
VATPSEDNGQRSRSPRSTGERLRHFADHVSYLKLIVLVAGGLFVCGFAVHQYVGDVVTTDDLDDAIKEDVAAPMREIKVQVGAANQRLDKLEIGEVAMDKRLDRQDRRVDMQSQQLYEIAVRVGARRVPGIIDKDAGP